MKRWHVVAFDDENAEPQDRVWTLSRDPSTEGWVTDGGYHGYGLTLDEATELADAANEAWERRAKGQPVELAAKGETA